LAMTTMKHSVEDVRKWIRIVQLMHAFGELDAHAIAELESIKGWKWETFTCTQSEALEKSKTLAREIGILRSEEASIESLRWLCVVFARARPEMTVSVRSA
jgi:hypothetical protein